jgi:hypothetical protein
MNYMAASLLSHSKTGELIQPGEPVDLSHLTPDEIALLMDLGAITFQPSTAANAEKED